MNTGRKLATRLGRLAGSMLILAGIGLSSSQGQDADAVTAVLAAGEVRYVGPAIKRGAGAAGAARKPQLAASTSTALARYAPHFGIEDPATQLRMLRATSLGAAGDIVRYRQLHQGLPVIGGELVLSLDGAGRLNSLSGETARDLQLATVQPAIGASQATQTALAAISKYHPEQSAGLTASAAELSVYVPGLIGPDSGAARLVWRLEVRGAAPGTVRELVLVDARNGGVALHFNQVAHGLAQATYTANGGSALPGTLLCDQGQPLCTAGANPHADLAHRYAAETYDFYLANHGRDSFDNLGATLVSTVNYFRASDCPNAFWNGTQMVYCTSLAPADDVVGHELTHAVTEKTSGLLYYYQSGAINESLSDLWGELVDLANSTGNDAPGNRWLIGEDLAGGAIRSMADPPSLGDPDRIKSPLYWYAETDNGGVHANSGINNKAVVLLADGGYFNGYTVAAIGISKVAALYYRVQTQHLTAGSNYQDLYLALNQACRNMIGGPEGITAGDCIQVANAVDAVEMNLQPVVGFASREAAICPANQVPVDAFYNGAENTTEAAQWLVSQLGGTATPWYFGSPFYPIFAAGKNQAYYTFGATTVSDYALTMANPVVVPANAFLHFRHSFDQEADAGGAYDGGMVEYSTNGTTWTDLWSLYSDGRGYGAPISIGFGNPAAGRLAFTGASGGFVSTRFNLASLAGQSLKIRFRNTSDSSFTTALSWAVDAVRIYSCAVDASANAAPVASAGADQNVGIGTPVTLDASGSFDPDGYLTAGEWTQLSGPAMQVQRSGRLLAFIAPLTPAQVSLVFRFTATDNRGTTAADEVTVTVVNQQPSANSGADQSGKPRDIITLQGTGTDSDGTIAGYSWTQTSGPTVAMGRLLRTAQFEAGSQTLILSAGALASGTPVLRLGATAASLANGNAITPASGVYFTCQAVSAPNACVQGGGTSLVGGSLVPGAATGQARTWTLQGTSLSTGSPVTGSFRYDAASSTFSNVALTVSGANASTVNFVAPSVMATATLGFQLTTTDNAGGTGTDEVVVMLTNQPPVANAGADLSAKAGAKVRLTGFATDPDGGIGNYSWVQTAGSAVALSNISAGVVEFKAPSADAASSLAFRLTATDIDGATSTDNITINVAAKESGGGGGSLDMWLLGVLGLLVLLRVCARQGSPAGRCLACLLDLLPCLRRRLPGEVNRRLLAPAVLHGHRPG